MFAREELENLAKRTGGIEPPKRKIFKKYKEIPQMGKVFYESKNVLL